MLDSFCYTKTVLILTSVLVSLILISVQSSLAQKNYHEAKIEFDAANYFTKKMWPCYNIEELCKQIPQERKKATIIVTDPDANKFNASIERVKVYVWSDTDRKGIIINAYETHVNSGIFEGTVIISDDQSTQNKIHVTDGDTLAAKYFDTTLPVESNSDSLEVRATSFIGHTGPPLERVPAYNLKVMDNKKQEISSVNVDQQVQIVADIINGQDRDQPFVYLVQISKDGVVHSLSWITGRLKPEQTLGPSQSWTPTASGTYNVQIYVWESIDNPDALSPSLEMTIKVA